MKDNYLNEDDILELAKEIIVNRYEHKHYQETVKIADYWHKIDCGENQGEILREMTVNRDEDQLAQRKHVYNTHTPYLSNRIRAQYKEVDRCDNISETLDIEETSKAESFTENMECFKGDMSLDDYLDMIAYDKAAIDPNSWLLVDFKPFDPTREAPTCYPLIIESKDAIYPYLKDGILQFMVFREEYEGMDYSEQGQKFVNKDKEVTPLKDWKIKETNIIYHVYTPNKSYQFIEAKDTIIDVSDYENVEIEDKTQTSVGYKYREHNHDSGHVPIYSLGFKKSLKHQYEVNESMMYPVRHLFNEHIAKKSRFDNMMAMYGFIKAWFLVPPCRHTTESGKRCSGGKCGQEVCPKCKGSGKSQVSIIHTNEQDIMTYEIPLKSAHPDQDEIPDISKYSHYQKIPKECIEFIRNELHFLEKSIAIGMFGSNVLDRTEISTATATEIKKLFKGVNNVLAEYASHKSRLWCNIVGQIAKYHGVKVKCSRKYPSELKSLSVGELLLLLKSAKDGGAGIDVINSIMNDIRKREYADNAEMLTFISQVERHKPFSNRSESEAAAALNMLPSNHPKKIKWVCWDDIVNEVRFDEGRDFTNMTFGMQKEWIDEIATRLNEENPLTSAQATFNPFQIEDEEQEPQPTE